MPEHHHVCPWWMGYLLVNPLRRLMQNPGKIISPYVREGMTILEIGPGMGYFTIPLARVVGQNGRIVAVDIQDKMLSALRKRVAKAGLSASVEARLAQSDTLGVTDLNSQVDFVLAFAVVHEVPDHSHFFKEVHAVLKPGATMLMSDPVSHFSAQEQEESLSVAQAAGFEKIDEPVIRRNRSALLRK